MIRQETLRELLRRADLTRMDKLLLCLAVETGKPQSIREIKALAKGAGLQAVQSWKVRDLLEESRGRAVKTEGGWELGSLGQEYVARLVGSEVLLPAPKLARLLRDHVSKLINPLTVTFVEEAIRCYEHKLFRAAVVLSWVGAVSILYQEVINKHLPLFNPEATRRNPKWKPAVTTDDLARMKEKDFLDILDHLSIIGKNVKQELENCLTLRNSCGHPNSLVIAEHRVSSHLEVLLLNVFAPLGS